MLGQEFSGVVAKVGKHVKAFSESDRVTSETAAVIDPSSPFTRTGRYNIDPARKGFGYGVYGAMAGFVRVPERCLYNLAHNVSFETVPDAPCRGRHWRVKIGVG